MTWSDWIQSPDYLTGVNKIAYSKLYGNSDNGSGLGPVSGGLTGATVQWSPPPPFGQGSMVYLTHEAGTEWVDARDWSPPELDALTLGVDYEQRPDRAPGDPDAYIEYESDDDNTFTGWAPALPGVTPVAPTLINAYGAAVAFGLYMLDGYSGEVPFPADEPLPTGALWATGSTVDTIGTTYASPPLPTGPIWAYVARLFDEPDESTLASLEWAAPALKYRMPRWRYWMTDRDAPLRLIRRGDGLGMGSGRVYNPGTRQASTRVFGVN